MRRAASSQPAEGCPVIPGGSARGAVASAGGPAYLSPVRGPAGTGRAAHVACLHDVGPLGLSSTTRPARS